MQYLNDIQKHINPYQWLIGGGVMVCEAATPTSPPKIFFSG